MNQPVEDSRPHWVHLLYYVINAMEGRSIRAGRGVFRITGCEGGMRVGLIENLRLEQRGEGSEAVCEWMSGGVSRWEEQPKQGPDGTFSGCQGLAQRPVWLGQSEQWKVIC